MHCFAKLISVVSKIAGFLIADQKRLNWHRWILKTHQNSFTEGVSDCFWKEGESRGMGAKPPKKLQNSPTSESPTNFPSSASFQELAARISFPWKSKKKRKKRERLKRSQPIVATSHFPPCLFSLIYWTTSKALALSCMLELHPLKRKIFDAVSRMNTSLWFNDDREKGTCEHTCIPIEIIFQTILS